MPPLPGSPLHCDILIVGGGVIGTAILYHLVCTYNSQATIVVVEKCSTVGSCASGNAGGFLAKNWCDGEGALQHLARTSFELHCAFAKGREGDIGFRFLPAVSVEICGDKSAQVNSRQQMSCHKNWLQGRLVGAVEQLTPQPHDANENEPTTAQVHPRLLCSAFVDEANKKSSASVRSTNHPERIRVLTSTAVEKLLFSEDGTRCVGVQVTSSSSSSTLITASIVILCVGPWTAHIERWLGSAATPTATATSTTVSVQNIQQQPIQREHLPILRRPACLPYLTELSRAFSPSKVQSIVIRLPPNHPIFDNNCANQTAIFTFPGPASEFPSCEPEIYPRPDGTVYVCGLSDKDPLPEDPASVVGNDEKANTLFRFADGVLNLRQQFQSNDRENDEKVSEPDQNDEGNSLNFASAVTFESHACYLPTPDDGRRPLIGEIPLTSSSLFVAAGHTCWGILNSHGTAVAISQMIQDRYPELFIDSSSEDQTGNGELQQNNKQSGTDHKDKLCSLIKNLEPKNLLQHVTQELFSAEGSKTSLSKFQSVPTKRKNENW